MDCRFFSLRVKSSITHKLDWFNPVRSKFNDLCGFLFKEECIKSLQIPVNLAIVSIPVENDTIIDSYEALCMIGNQNYQIQENAIKEVKDKKTLCGQDFKTIFKTYEPNSSNYPFPDNFE